MGMIACGMHHSLLATTGADASSTTLCVFGWAEHGRLGLGDGIDDKDENYVCATPVCVLLPKSCGSITAIAAGAQHSAVAGSCGEIWAFGSNEFGQLGCSSSMRVCHTPVRMELPSQASGKVVQLVCTSSSTAIVT